MTPKEYYAWARRGGEYGPPEVESYSLTEASGGITVADAQTGAPRFVIPNLGKKIQSFNTSGNIATVNYTDRSSVVYDLERGRKIR